MPAEKAQSWLREYDPEDGWQALSRSHQEIGEEITQLVGMSREQFCQVVLLPQGDFARFLRAGTFQFPASGVTLFIRDIADDGTLRDLLLEDARNPARQTLYTAEEALIVRSDTGPKLIMVRGAHGVVIDSTWHSKDAVSRVGVTSASA